MVATIAVRIFLCECQKPRTPCVYQTTQTAPIAQYHDTTNLHTNDCHKHNARHTTSCLPPHSSSASQPLPSSSFCADTQQFPQPTDEIPAYHTEYHENLITFHQTPSLVIRSRSQTNSIAVCHPYQELLIEFIRLSDLNFHNSVLI